MTNITNTAKENRRLEFRIKKIDEARNYLLKEIKHNDLTSKKHKETCRYFNYFEHFLLFISVVTRSVSIYLFALLVDFSIRITSSTVGLKIWAITPGIKKFKSIIKN